MIILVFYIAVKFTCLHLEAHESNNFLCHSFECKRALIFARIFHQNYDTIIQGKYRFDNEDISFI